jgi:hypothetical protein
MTQSSTCPGSLVANVSIPSAAHINSAARRSLPLAKSRNASMTLGLRARQRKRSSPRNLRRRLPNRDEVNLLANKIKAEAEFFAERSELAKTTVDLFRNLDNQLKLTTGNTIDLKIVLAGGLAAYTFWEIGADAATPMWVTLALFSLNHFAELHSGLPAMATDPVGTR